MSNVLKAAVLVENHPYNVIGFQEMLDSFTDCKCYVQPVDLFVQDDTMPFLIFKTGIYIPMSAALKNEALMLVLNTHKTKRLICT